MSRPEPSRIEFIALIASIMMIVAFGIDAMLPALPAIGQSLRVADPTDWALVITVFTIGFGVAQLFAGPLSDRYGRKRLLIGSLAANAAFNLLAALSGSFVALLFARFASGFGAAGARVLVTAVVRDRFAGRDMAQVMSLAAAVFMAAPILAPFMGTAVLLVAPWPWIFVVLAALSAALFVWTWRRLPETLAVEKRIPLERHALVAAAHVVLTDRQSVGYTIANTCFTVAIMGFLTSVQLVFAQTLGRPDLLPWGFAAMASVMMVASLVNSRIVMIWGMRRIGHWALIVFTAVAAFHAVFASVATETLWTFVALQSLMMVGFSLAVGNFGALGMERMGDAAGMASSLQGAFSSILGSLGGAIIGQSFDGSTVPLYTGITIAGLAALTAVLWAEGGRLFVVRSVPPVSEVAEAA